MELQEALCRSVKEIFMMLNCQPELKMESEETALTSAAEVNALVGFNHSIKGNMVLALDKDSALKITALMTGEFLSVIDAKAKTAIGDLAKMVVDLSIGKLNISSTMYFAPPPTLITGTNVFLLISRTGARRLLFQIKDAAFSIAYSLE